MKSLQAHELFRGLSPTTAEAILAYFRADERPVYTAVLSSLAGQRKLRPVFVQRKPAAQQIDWLIKTLKLRSSEESAQQVMELWLMKKQVPMMNAFLESLGVDHDDEGRAEDIPETLDEAKVKEGVDTLLKTFEPEAVAIYLNVFNGQQTGGWPAVEQVLDDPRLALPGLEPSA